jgi:hypothetical protein
MVFELTVGTSPRDFVKIILQKMCSNLIGVDTKLLFTIFYFN